MTEQPYKVHLSEDGEPRECRATADCPLKNSDGSPAKHFDTKDDARAYYASKMEESAHSTMSKRPAKELKLDNDLYVSVLTSSEHTFTEGFPDTLSRELEPGDYTAMYHDEESNRSRYMHMSVNGQGQISYKKMNRFQAITSPASARVKQAVDNLNSDLKKISENSDPSTCKRNHMDRITLMETSQEIKRRVAAHDWNTAVGASQGRADLEEVEWALDHDIAVAEEQGLTREANAIRESKKTLSDFMRNTTRPNMASGSGSKP